MDNNELIKRFLAVKARRTTVQATWDLIEEYVTPYRGRMFKDITDEHAVDWKQRQLWDSTAVMAHQNLAASLHGALTSPSIRWFDIRFRKETLNKNTDAAAWLRRASDRTFYELQDSNFNLEVNECYQDICGFGTGFISEEEVNADKWDGLIFSGVPLKEAFFEEDFKGQVRYFYRLMKWDATKLVSKFGDKVPEKIKEAAEKGSDEKFEVVFCIYPRKVEKPEYAKVLSPKQRPFGYKYLCVQGGEELGQEGGYYEMPVFAPRWRKTSESVWGNSPAMFALADILTLNEWVEIMTVWSEKQTDPPIFAEERSVITDLDLSASSLNTVRDINGIKEFVSRGNVAVTEMGLEKLRANIRNYFFNDQLNFPDPQATPMTATEAQIRYELMQRLLGPTLGRLQSDMLDPIIQRTFNLLARAGEFGDIPDILLQENPDMDVEYLGALARAQRIDQAQAVERWAMSLGNLSQVMPGVLDVPNDEKIARELGLLLNVDPSLMRSGEEVKAERDKRAQQEQMAQQAALANAAGEAAQSVGAGEQALNDAEQTIQ
jgi:hypothetical protein